MKIENVAALRNTLEQMETQQLDDLLLKELREEMPNGELIRLISSILKERDRDTVPKIDANIQQAWERYQKKTQTVHKKPRYMNSFLLKAASLILVLLTLMVLMPQEAKAMNFFERFIAWTEDVFSLISPAEAKEQKEEYVFRTDNPGLQEVYDKVTELGVTVPVVPTWLPEGYELVEIKVNGFPTNHILYARFSNGIAEALYQISVYSDNVTYEYYKDKSDSTSVEKNGIIHTIMSNNDLSVVVWTMDNIQCSISIDCQGEDWNRILDSIYTTEVN